MVVDSLPENDDACAEILELLVDYLPKRYPTLFERLSPNGIWNKVTDEKIPDITGKSGVDALLIVSRLVQDDFLMGREGPDGQVYFTGGLVAFPGMCVIERGSERRSSYITGFYLLSNYIGKPLEEVSGLVYTPSYYMLTSLDNTGSSWRPLLQREDPQERRTYLETLWTT